MLVIFLLCLTASGNDFETLDYRMLEVTVKSQAPSHRYFRDIEINGMSTDYYLINKRFLNDIDFGLHECKERFIELDEIMQDHSSPLLLSPAVIVGASILSFALGVGVSR